MTLYVLVGGMQNRPELLSKELREKATNFTKLVMPFCNSRTQVHLLEIRYALGAPEKAISTMEPGLNSRNSKVVLDTTSRIVNAINEMTELADAYLGNLVSVIIMVGLRSLAINRGRSNIPSALRLADGAGAAAIILYGTVFGLGGLLQLITFWPYVFLQVCEIGTAVFVVCPMVAARYNKRWRMFVLSRDFQTYMKNVSLVLAIFGAIWTVIAILYDLTTFTMPLMVLLVGYSLMWPACALFYLMSDRRPTIANVVFPLPRIVYRLYAYIVERRRDSHNNR